MSVGDKVYFHSDPNPSHLGKIVSVEDGIHVQFNLDGYEFIDQYSPHELRKIDEFLTHV